MNEKDQQFMGRAIQLALLGKGTVSPNPMVGCVITVNNKIIGEGWHQRAGEAHAEVNAVHAVQDNSLLDQATAYVTLEPCAHYGKTPPCAEFLVKHKIKRVVVGSVDPNPLVAGKGVAILKAAGIQVDLNCLEMECLSINEIFFHSLLHKTPYVVLKWAQTADGFVARNNFDSKWISSSRSRQLVHKWRAEYDAILVGKNTVLYDDPSLNVRDWNGKSPVRIVIDHNCVLPNHLKIFDQSELTIVYNLVKDDQDSNVIWVKLNETQFLEHLLKDLYKRKVTSLFIEGGSSTLAQFIENELWNEARVFVSRTNFIDGIQSPRLYKHELIESSNNTEDNLFTYKRIQ